MLSAKHMLRERPYSTTVVYYVTHDPQETLHWRSVRKIEFLGLKFGQIRLLRRLLLDNFVEPVPHKFTELAKSHSNH